MKALIVEDDFFVRSLLFRILGEFGECHVAVNGQEALVAIESAMDAGQPYDLVCLDIVMPVMDGQEALLKLRELEASRGWDKECATKVIMISAVDDSQRIMDAFRHGQCEAYLTKPLDREKLLKHIAMLGLITGSGNEKNT
jgi:two-component system chemotaxis response regulator CheY